MRRNRARHLALAAALTSLFACAAGSEADDDRSASTSGATAGGPTGHGGSNAGGALGKQGGAAGAPTGAGTSAGGAVTAGVGGWPPAGAATAGKAGQDGSAGSASMGASAGTGGSSGGGGHGGSPTKATTAKVSFRTLLTGHYVAADDAGVTAKSASIGTAEALTLTDLDGGGLADGDEIWLSAANGKYVGAVGGGGGLLVVSAQSAGPDETFVLHRVAGPGAISPGDGVALEVKAKPNYLSAIDGGGGQVLANAPWIKEWEMFNIAIDGKGLPPSTSSQKQRVLDYLASISGKRTVAGQHNKENKGPAASTDEIAGITGKVPGLWSADFGFGQGSLDARPAIIAEAKKQWNAGAIVQLMYHTCSIMRDELCGWSELGGANAEHLSDAEWTALVTDGTPLHQAWLARLDKLSVFLAELKAAGVAPLFRPLHEMNQGVFWWGGRSGANGTRRLFQITHDYLVKAKGFDNIIWVWDLQDFSSLESDAVSYHPGAAYFDLAALDMYEAGYTQKNYDIMLKAAGGKPIALGECATLPTSAELTKQPAWVFFMLWPDFIGDQKGALPPLYGASNVVTLGQIPGWK